LKEHNKYVDKRNYIQRKTEARINGLRIKICKRRSKKDSKRPEEFEKFVKEEEKEES